MSETGRVPSPCNGRCYADHPGMEHDVAVEYDRRGAMTNAPGPPSGPRWRCTCGGWNPSSEAVCRFRDCDGRKTTPASSSSANGEEGT